MNFRFEDDAMLSRQTIFAACLWSVIAFWSKPSSAAPTVAGVWRTDFTQAQAEAEKLHRPLVIHFYADWCGPCKNMERSVLHAPDVLRPLDGGFIAVKVNFDRSPAIAAKFKVESLPTDVIVGPDGRVLSWTVGAQEKAAYLAAIHRIDAKFAALRKPEPTPSVAATVPPAPPPPLSESAGPGGVQVAQSGTVTVRDDVATGSTEPNGTSAEGQAVIQSPPPAAEPVVTALDGFCPVTLWTTRTWKRGVPELSWEYQGLTYHFQSEVEFEKFKADPSRYAPRLLGCDPVVLSEKDLAIPGTTKYGAYFEGELYLFESGDNRSRFRNDPRKFTRTAHVLKPEDVRKRRA